MRHYWYGPGDGLWMIGGLVLLVLLIVLVVWVVNSLTRDRASHGSGSARPPDAGRPTLDDILRERFARGEITQEQLEQARKVLGLDR
jgi:uncharacterized membrane protein